MIKSLLLALFAFLSLSAQAHKASDAYLRIESSTAAQTSSSTIKLSIALRDLDRAIETLDANNDRQLTSGEVKAALPQILGWVKQGLALRCLNQEQQTEQGLSFNFEALEQRSDGVFTRLAATLPAGCEPANTELRYSLMQGLDADHRAILSIADKDASTSTNNSTNGSARVLAPSAQWMALQAEKPSIFSTLLSFIVLGMEHIGSGADHIAFVICLVLGLTLWRDWSALLTTVTAFTVGHSMTLIAATLGWVGSPGWVEPVIAFSIAVAAALNLIATRVAGAALAAWSDSLLLKAAVATGFGLVHGLGFSGAMTEAQVPQGALLWALAGFNIGVELGQLLIIAAWSVIYFALRKWTGYQRWIVQAGSVALMVLAMYWFFERLGVLG